MKKTICRELPVVRPVRGDGMVGQGPRGAVGVLRADRRRLAVSVADFCRLAFASVGLDWRHYVKGDSALTRPAEVIYLCGDASRAKNELRWKPTVTLEELVAMMVAADLTRVGADGAGPAQA